MTADQSEAEAAMERLTEWCDLMEAPPPPEGYAESDDYIHALVYDDAPVDVVLSDDIRLLLAERRGLREALERIEGQLNCRGDPETAHYCPNCDNSLWDVRAVARSALQGKGGGGE